MTMLSVLKSSERGSKLWLPTTAIWPSTTIDFECRPTRTPARFNGAGPLAEPDDPEPKIGTPSLLGVPLIIAAISNGPLRGNGLNS